MELIQKSLLLCILTLVMTNLFGQTAIPKLERRVTDQIGLLSKSEVKNLESELAALEKTKGSQIAILIVSSTGRETIEQYSIRVVDQWQLGREGVDDGVLLLVAKDDRKLRIEVGYGLEGAIPDALAKRIIERIILPHFRDGDFYQGIEEGTEAIIGLINGEALPEPTKSSSGSDPMESPYIVLVFALISFGIIGLVAGGTYLSKKIGKWKSNFVILSFIFLVIWAISGVIQVAVFVSLIVLVVMVLQGGNKGGGHGGAGMGGYSSWGGGYSGGGFSGGGFGGGGGGFGGGGASGGW